MKTSKQIQDEIDFLKNNFKALYPNRQLLSNIKDGKRIAFLTLCQRYVEMTPSLSDESIRQEIDRLQKRIELISGRLGFYIEEIKKKQSGVSEKSARSSFEKEFDIKGMKRQVKTLKYILQ